MQVAVPLLMNTVKRITWKTGAIWRSNVIFRFRCYYPVIWSLHFVTLYNVVTGKAWNAYIYNIYLYLSIYLSIYSYVSIYNYIHTYIYIYIYIYIIYIIYCKIYAMKAWRPFVVINAAAWKVKVANILVMFKKITANYNSFEKMNPIKGL